MSLSNIQVKAMIKLSASKVGELGSLAVTPSVDTGLLSLTDGTTASKADTYVPDARELAASGTQDYDLDAGSLTDEFGDAVTLAEVVGIIVKHNSDSEASGINISGDLLGLTTDSVQILPGGCFMLFAPTDPAYAVTATTADVITITNEDASNAATYEIIILGRTA